jgi:putative heme transporter
MATPASHSPASRGIVASGRQRDETARAGREALAEERGGMTQAQPDTTAEVVAGEQPPAPATGWRNPRVRQALQIAVSILIVGGIFWFVLGQFADLSSVWDAMRSLTWREIAILLAFAVWNLATYWIQLVVCTPGLTYPQAVVLTETTTAVSNALPAGGAIGVGLTYSILGSWGFSNSRATLAVLLSGIWNNFLKLGLPVVALAILAVQGEGGGGSMIAALAGLAGLVAAVTVFALILRSEDFARQLGRFTERIANRVRGWFGKQPAHGYDHAVLKFRARVKEFVRRRWIVLTLVTLIGHLALFQVLLVSLRVMGVSEQDASWSQVLAVFAFARLVTAIPLTPGGVGIVELALISGISAAGGEKAEVVAAVLIFRLLTYVVPIVFGALTYMYWRHNRSWRDSAPPAPDWLTPALAEIG